MIEVWIIQSPLPIKLSLIFNNVHITIFWYISLTCTSSVVLFVELNKITTHKTEVFFFLYPDPKVSCWPCELCTSAKY